MVRILNVTFDVVPLQFSHKLPPSSYPYSCLFVNFWICLLQGNLVVKDFDIRKNASGASFQAVQMLYNKVQVSENYLEIHLFWAGKGTCCIPDQGTFGPTISAISANRGNKAQKL